MPSGEREEAARRRRKLDEKIELVLPQKKRSLAFTTAAESESLIRETEAALKTLSGSWAGGSRPQATCRDEKPAFENLFADGRPDAADSNSLKDVITFRDAHSAASNAASSVLRVKREIDHESVDYDQLDDDDSSPELEIDMSLSPEAATCKDNRDDSARPFLSTPSSSFSSASAFRPPSSKLQGGHYADAFGYHLQGASAAAIAAVEKAKSMGKADLPPGTSAGGSKPDSSKQYTILQPTGVASRAASALQEAARDAPIAEAKVLPGALSPASISRGGKHFPNKTKQTKKNCCRVV